jgi:hypothetical protein
VKYRLEAMRVAADADAEVVVPHRLGLTRKTITTQALHNLPISVLDLVPKRPGEPAGRAGKSGSGRDRAANVRHPAQPGPPVRL